MKFEDYIQSHCQSGSTWKWANRIKSSRNIDNSPTQQVMVIFGDRNKIIAVAECLKDYFSLETDDTLRSYCKPVRQEAQLYCETIHRQVI